MMVIFSLLAPEDERLIESNGFKYTKLGNRKKRSERVDTPDPSIDAFIESMNRLSMALADTYLQSRIFDQHQKHSRR